MARLDLYLPTLMAHEGGFVNNPKDPGGATNKGITLRTFQAFYGKSKTVEDLKKITDAQVYKIAKEGFYDQILAPLIYSQDVADIFFDHAFSAGNSRAVTTIQKVLKDKFKKSIVVDGKMGRITVAAINSVDANKLFNYYWDARERHYRLIALLNTKLAVFLKGWLTRLKTFKKKPV